MDAINSVLNSAVALTYVYPSVAATLANYTMRKNQHSIVQLMINWLARDIVSQSNSNTAVDLAGCFVVAPYLIKYTMMMKYLRRFMYEKDDGGLSLTNAMDVNLYLLISSQWMYTMFKKHGIMATSQQEMKVNAVLIVIWLTLSTYMSS
jgi:hypothetical protein